MTTRKYSSRSQQTTLSAALSSTATTASVISGTALLGGVTISAGETFTVVIDPDTALEEIVDVTAVASNTLTIVRGIDGSSGQEHSAGAIVRHMAVGRDYREANTHIEASTGVHGLGAGSAVVGTTDTQTLTNKTLTSPTISNPTISGVIGGNGITFEGATADAFETTLAVTDPTADRTITLPNADGNVVLDTLAQTLTNKTLTAPVITGLSNPTNGGDAANKTYVDSILGSATSAAASAAAAATSATSAATSASSSATSASSSATSASAAATSATNAAASAAAAATSVSTVAASAAAAATSATSAATSASSSATSASASAASATAAASSATSASDSATAASSSATAAASSATSAASSATSAANSYDSFDDRYLGAKASAPTVDNDGNALLTGALYWNTASNKMYVWSGTAWGEISSSADIIAYKYTVSAGATSVSGADDNGLTLAYLVGKEQVYINGVLQVRGSDYTATTGSSITGMTALAANDIVTVLAFTAFSVSNTIGISTLSAKGDILTASASSTPAVLAVGSNNQTILADSSTATGLKWGSSPQSLMTSTGDILYASSANTPAKLGIGSSGQLLTVSGGVPAWAAAPASGLTLIKTSTFSGASNSSTTFDGVFTSTYLDYILVCHNIEISTADSYLYFQYRKAGATKNGTIYTDSFMGISANNAPNGTQYWNDGTATQHQILKSGPGSDSASSTTINICYTNWPKFHGTSYNGYRNWLLYGGGLAYVNDTFDGFICSTSAGTFTGTISIYGLAKS